MPINILMMKINQPNSLTHFSMNNQTHEKVPYSRWFIGCNILSSKFTPFLHKDFPYPIPTFLPYWLKSNLSLKCPSLEIFPDNFLPQNSNPMQVKFQLSKKNNAQAMPMPLVRRCVLRVETYLASITIQTWIYTDMEWWKRSIHPINSQFPRRFSAHTRAIWPSRDDLYCHLLLQAFSTRGVNAQDHGSEEEKKWKFFRFWARTTSQDHGFDFISHGPFGGRAQWFSHKWKCHYFNNTWESW